MRFNDPAAVAREYASEERFLARRVTFVDYVEGQNAEQLAFEALAEIGPRRVLEVGCGTGAFAERMLKELGADVVALDLSPRMVELARERGVEALVGTAEALPFRGEEFDCVVANWVLHHVPDLDRGLAEIARVLRPGGCLLAPPSGRRTPSSCGSSSAIPPWESSSSRARTARRSSGVTSTRSSDVTPTA